MSGPKVDGAWLGQTLEQFYGLKWTTLSAPLREDLVAWWSDKIRDDGEGASGEGKAAKDKRELIALDIVKAVGYVLDPDVFVRKHGDGQIKFLDVKDVYYAKILLKKHRVPIKIS